MTSAHTHTHLAPQHEDSVDVREDAVETEVNVWTDQRKNRGQDAGSRLELRDESQTRYLKGKRNLRVNIGGGVSNLRQDSIDGVPALRQHQVFVKHEVEGEGLAEGVRADAGLLCAVLLEAVQVLVEGLLLRVLLFNQKLDVVTLLALRLNHLQQLKS